MDPLRDLLTTRRTQTSWEFTIEPYPSWRFGFIDNLDLQIFQQCDLDPGLDPKWRSGKVANTTSVTPAYMPGHRLTRSRYANQKNVEHFSDPIVHLNGQSLTHITRVVCLFVIAIRIGYPVHRFTSTGLIPFEESPEQWGYPGEVYSADWKDLPHSGFR